MEDQPPWWDGSQDTAWLQRLLGSHWLTSWTLQPGARTEFVCELLLCKRTNESTDITQLIFNTGLRQNLKEVRLIFSAFSNPYLFHLGSLPLIHEAPMSKLFLPPLLHHAYMGLSFPLAGGYTCNGFFLLFPAILSRLPNSHSAHV